MLKNAVPGELIRILPTEGDSFFERVIYVSDHYVQTPHYTFYKDGKQILKERKNPASFATARTISKEEIPKKQLKSQIGNLKKEITNLIYNKNYEFSYSTLEEVYELLNKKKIEKR